ncbi:MAG: DUF1467 family protein [Pseudomonadota bacterium]
MNPGAVVVVFVIWWWLAFFALLPTGVRGQWEEGESVKGSDPGAPVNPDLKRKAVRASLAAAVLTAVTCAIIVSDLINFRE